VNTSPSLSSLVQYFFTQHLCEHRRSSARTVVAYRDTFRLLLSFLQSRTGHAPTALTMSDLDAPAILAFLDHLEVGRHNQIRSRNARLAAIRSFFRIVAVRDPANLGIVNRVLAIPTKRTDHLLITYITRVEMDAVLAAPDPSGWLGRRDHALLLTMYNSGARASEIVNLRCGQVTFGSNTYVQLHGKECHSYCIFLRPRHETTGKHTGQQVCNLAFSLADVLLAVRTGIGLGPYTGARGVSRADPMSELYPA
jgi:integrase/recombinase XerD